MYRRFRQIVHTYIVPVQTMNGRRPIGRKGACLLVCAGLLLVIASAYGMWPWSTNHPDKQPVQKERMRSVLGGSSVRSSSPMHAQMGEQFVYANLNWTITQVVDRPAIGEMRIPAGLHPIEITLRIDNPLAQEVIPGSAYDYLSMTIGTQIFVPLAVTLPVAFPADIRGETGTVTFLVPLPASPCTLTFSSNAVDGYYPVSIELTLPS